MRASLCHCPHILKWYPSCDVNREYKCVNLTCKTGDQFPLSAALCVPCWTLIPFYSVLQPRVSCHWHACWVPQARSSCQNRTANFEGTGASQISLSTFPQGSECLWQRQKTVPCLSLSQMLSGHGESLTILIPDRRKALMRDFWSTVNNLLCWELDLSLCTVSTPSLFPPHIFTSIWSSPVAHKNSFSFCLTAACRYNPTGSDLPLHPADTPLSLLPNHHSHRGRTI